MKKASPPLAAAGWRCPDKLWAIDNRISQPWLDETLTEVLHTLVRSLASDQRLALSITRARRSQDDHTKHLALDLFLQRADSAFGGGQ